MSDNIDVKNYLDQLKRVLPSVPPVPIEPLKALHAVQDYKGMVQLIKKSMNIADIKFLLFWVSEGAARQNDAPAWIELPRLPDRLPFYGTKEFKETSLRIYFRKSFLKRTYDQVAIAIAHELSHVVLDSIRHPLFRDEKAVDLTAMLLGFRRLYLSGAHTQADRIGYLSEAEIGLANNLLEASPSDATKSLRKASRMGQAKGVLSTNLGGVFALAWLVLASMAIWFAAAKSGGQAATTAPPVLQSRQFDRPSKQNNSGAMKATIPQSLLDNLMTDSFSKMRAH
jgi:hypothetical protein